MPPRTLIHPGYKAHPDRNIIPASPPRENTPTPPKRGWYDCSWLIPDTILRRRRSRDDAQRQWAHGHAHSSKHADDDVAKQHLASSEEGRPLDLEEAQGNVDSGHCAEAADWDERGQCMCTITWQMPGRYPVTTCTMLEDVLNGLSTVRSASTSDTGSQARDPANQPAAPPVRWERAYNLQTERHEYVAMQDARRHDGGSSDSNDGTTNSNGDNENAPRDAAAPFTCTSKPSWVQHVRRFVRAEELPTPPPPASQFIARTNKSVSATIKARFSPGYFLVPYYSGRRRCFEYADGQMDMANLELKFTSDAPPPPPKPVPQKHKPPLKRPLVMPHGRRELERPKPVVYPTFAEDVYRPVYPQERVEIAARQPSYQPVKVKPAREVEKKVFQRPRSVMFPQWRDADVDDTPCPPPRKRLGRVVAKTRRMVTDDDGEYLPSEDSELETTGGMAEKPRRSPPALKKKKKRRRRRNSDPTYKQHGVREDNRIEKEDLEKMRQEEEAGETEPVGPQDPPRQKRARFKIVDVKPKPKTEPEPIPATKRSTEKFSFWGPARDADPPARQNRRRNKDSDDAYVPSKDPEEEERERKDLRDMNKEVDTELEKVEGFERDRAEPEQPAMSNRRQKPKAVQARRRAPVGDRAYRPGKQLRI
ncbi:hypothetical protein TWF696_009728 [Orbilia brochopaga]|uniref:Uncharacterized protein n=1 Tax=Orbilia brochopaga TaxID=3140254 RepID=A0AAV9UD11_9PEZI